MADATVDGAARDNPTITTNVTHDLFKAAL
jgi:hypothetical protein